MDGKLRVTLIKSPISHNPANRATVRALGLHRIGQTVEINDNPATRGMVRAIRFLLRAEEAEGGVTNTDNDTATTETAEEPAAAKRQTKEKASS